jgi:hypothetical protein
MIIIVNLYIHYYFTSLYLNLINDKMNILIQYMIYELTLLYIIQYYLFKH